MFGIRTPDAKQTRNRKAEQDKTKEIELTWKEGEIKQQSSVRRSIGEWESGKPDTLSRTSTTPKKVPPVELPKPKTVPANQSGPNTRPVARRVSVEAVESPPKQENIKHNDRLSEARACVMKAKLNLANSRNIKTEIKIEVTKAIERLFQLVKESESMKGQGTKKQIEKEKKEEPQKIEEQRKLETEIARDDSELIKRIEEHTKAMKENTEKIEKLKETLEKHQEKVSYASAAAASTRRIPVKQTALHSVVVTSKDDQETGEQVLNRIREAINAKDGGITVERIRKAKDQKVIVGCRTEEERRQVQERLKRAEEHLNVEKMKNKNPLIILRGVFKFNSDEDILNSLSNQNKDVFGDLDLKTEIIEFAYKKKTHNIHAHHVVMRVPPRIWQRMVDAGSVRIDLQRVRVADQSPLVQCSLCLGYGHGRRYCGETLEKCSHCGGAHVKTECEKWKAGVSPSCCNCAHAKAENTAHNAFSQECTIRQKWDALARATIAYC